MSFRAFSSIFRRRPCIAHSAPRTRKYASAPPAKNAPKGSGANKVLSSCEPDTVITGVNYFKGQPPVLALPDGEYPEWLWKLLEPRVWPDDGPGGRGERAARRAANKQRIKEANFMATQ